MPYAPAILIPSPVNVCLVSWVMVSHALVSAPSTTECIVTHTIMLLLSIYKPKSMATLYAWSRLFGFVTVINFIVHAIVRQVSISPLFFPPA